MRCLHCDRQRSRCPISCALPSSDLRLVHILSRNIQTFVERPNPPCESRCPYNSRHCDYSNAYLDGTIRRACKERLLCLVHAYRVYGAIVGLELVQDAHLPDVNDAKLALLAPCNQLVAARRADKRRAGRLLVALERCARWKGGGGRMRVVKHQCSTIRSGSPTSCTGGPLDHSINNTPALPCQRASNPNDRPSAYL